MTILKSYSDETITQVWRKGRAMEGLDSSIWRLDTAGAMMNFAKYGQRDSVFGWEIDHINPVSAGGGDELGNLQPLQWQNNLAKGDIVDGWRPAVVYDPGVLTNVRA